MISLRRTQHCRWRNYFTEHPVMVMDLDLTGSANWTTASLPPELARTLTGKLPGLQGVLAGEGAASLAANLALQLQRMADPSPPVCGVAETSADRTTATAFFACLDMQLGMAVSDLAVRLAGALTSDSALTSDRLSAMLDAVARQVGNAGLDQSSRALAAAASQRGIPWFRIGMSRYLQLGQGHTQRRIRETLRSGESAIALELSASKVLTLQILNAVGLPVGRFALVAGVDSTLKAAEAIGYPIVLKPDAGKKGEGVRAGLQNADELRAALANTAQQGRQFLLQNFFPGSDHRLLVVSGRLIAAARREAASVVGDGKTSVAGLIETCNADPRRGSGFSNLMNRIEIDDEVVRVLSGQDLTPDSIPTQGAFVRLRATANISTGGTAVDVTDVIHPDNARAAVKAAKTLDLQVAGVDFISPDISRSWREVGGGICEVNCVVGLRPHWIADPHRDVAGPILETMYPAGDTGRIPTAMITGTKGKSSTALMLSAILSCAGHCVGTVTTDGVAVAEEMVLRGDASGISGADIALRDPTVTAAVLETARGGLVRRGMYLDHCDVAALLNIGREQIEMDGIESLDDMARLKRKVLEAARSAIVLNADDERSAAMADEFPLVRKIMFSMQPEASTTPKLVHTGDVSIFLKTVNGRETVAIRDGVGESVLLSTDDLPSSMGGIVRLNIANAMAAAGLALGLGVARETIVAGLRGYENTVERTFGRFNLVEGFPMQILFDRAVQAPAFAALVEVLDKMPVAGKRVCVVTSPGNRPDFHFSESAEVLAGHFDQFICFERPDFLRGKQPGEISSLLTNGLVAAGVAQERITAVLSNEAAAEIVAREAEPDDFVAVLGSDAPESISEYRDVFDRLGAASE